MLNRLQSLFNRLAGVPDPVIEGPHHLQRSYAGLDKPACWRRRMSSPVTARRQVA